MNPSIKNKEDNEGLWQGLLDGVIEVIATDHAPHTLEEKNQPYPKSPSGLPAVENSLSLLLNQVNLGKCSLEQVVGWMAENPARIWGIVDRGQVEVGFHADMVLVDLEREHTIENENQETKSKWSPWAGTTLKGLPVMTIVNGEVVFDHHTNPANPQFAKDLAGQEIQFKHSV